MPSTIFLALVGLPQSDLPDFLRWRDDTIRPQPDEHGNEEQKREAAGKAIEDYFERMIEEKRAHPDAGGNARDFQELSAARDALMKER